MFRRLRGRTPKLAATAGSALELEVERGFLLLCVPVLLGLGAMIYFALPTEPPLSLLLPACGVVSVVMVCFSRRHLLFLASAAMLICLVGVAAGRIETLRLSTKMLGSEVTTRLTGRIVSIDRLATSRVRLTLDVVATDRPKLRYAPERVRVTAGRVDGAVRAGAVVSGLVRLMPPAGPVMPGGYDFSFESYFDGIGATGFFLGAPKILPPSIENSGLRIGDWIENSRQRMADRIKSEVGGPEGEIAAALIVGTRGGIPESVNESLRRTGLAHILSISGLHMALVAVTVMGSVRALLAFFPVLASRRPIKKIAAAGGLGAVTIYAVFSGSDVAALRSFLMLGIMLSSVFFDRAALTMRNLALAAIVILLWTPHELLGPSFQMSFAATAALVAVFQLRPLDALLASRLAPRAGMTTRLLSKGTSVLLALGATSLVAGLATATFGIYHFQRVSPLSLPANLAVTPVVSILVMPFALLGMLAMPFGLDGPFFAVMGFGLRLMTAISAWFSGRTPLDAVGTIPAASLALVAAATVVATTTTTWLRFLAFAPLVAGLVAMPMARPPDILISDDAKMVAVSEGKNRLAINVERGGGFTVKNWLRATRSSSLLRPATASGKGASAESGKTVGDAGLFICNEGFCTARHSSGAIIARVEDGRDAERACLNATIALIADPTFRGSCLSPGRTVFLVTARELALRGNGALWLPPMQGPNSTSPTVRFSVPQPLRPWHSQRRYSRAARGLPDRGPKS